jgi:integrase
LKTAIRGLSTQKEKALRRTRYQDGSLRLRERPGQKNWEYRWYEIQIDGTRKRRSVNLGSIQDYPTEAAAMKAVSALRANINMETPRAQIQAISFDTLVEHYRMKEMGEDSDKTFATRETYEGYLRKWIRPRWQSYRLRDVKSVAVEEWLKTLPLVNGSRAKIRNMMHAIFNHALRWEWYDRNPITRVRQSAKRSRIPVVLTIAQIQALLTHLREPVRTMVLVDVSTGLRIGELLALQWRDIDFENFEISVTRSISLQHVGNCKTETSRKPVPMDAELAEALWHWRGQSGYPKLENWVFASPAKNGEQPYWPGTLYRAHLEPAAKAAGIPGKIGWHTFRHTFATLLKANGEDIKTVQELLRHANISVTMNVYAQGVTELKRNAQHRIVRMVTGGKDEEAEETA